MSIFLYADPIKSKGRLFSELEEETNRTPFERDRDRIIHSSSFRKLKHKTQVFIESDSDYYRTRLTHSLEVAQISRSLCRAMKLNEDLGEVVSLAHDLGHPPFGHNGEKALNNSMLDFDGFNHNDQTLRVLTHIEKRHPNFSGLNLTWESLEGIAKHNGVMTNSIPFHIFNYNKNHDLYLNLNPHLESQIAAISDDIAYNNHDIQDGIKANLFKLKDLVEINFFKEIYKSYYKNKSSSNYNILVYQIIRDSIDLMVKDLIRNTIRNLKKNKINKIQKIYNLSKPIVCFSNKFNNIETEIKHFLKEKMYKNKNVLNKNNKGKKIVKKLYGVISKNPYKFLSRSQLNNNKTRAIADFISGMTDRYAINLYSSKK